MMNRVLAIGGVATLMFAFAVVTPTAGARPLQPPPPPGAAQVQPQRALLDRYCIGCHSQPAKAAGQEPARKLTLDDLDVARVSAHGDVWERVVRKMRAGMMPPAGSRRPDKATYDGFIAWLETELDRGAAPVRAAARSAPREPHGIRQRDPRHPGSGDRHRRASRHPTIRRRLRQHGRRARISSTLVEAYVSAAGKISRLAIGEPAPPGLVVYRTPEDTSQDYHIEGLPFGTRGGMLVKHVFPSDGEYTHHRDADLRRQHVAPASDRCRAKSSKYCSTASACS